MRCIFFLLAFLLSAVIVEAQTYHFDNYNVIDGLSQSTVYSMAQDNNGIVWIGNKSGISMFDGIKFKNFSTKDGAAGNGARTLYKDSLGNIWFGHLGGGITFYLFYGYMAELMR